jgi:hypothetical protein
VRTHALQAELRDVTALQSMLPPLQAAVDEAKHAVSPGDLGSTAEIDSKALMKAQDTVDDLQSALKKAERRVQHGHEVEGASVDQIKKDIAAAQLKIQQLQSVGHVARVALAQASIKFYPELRITLPTSGVVGGKLAALGDLIHHGRQKADYGHFSSISTKGTHALFQGEYNGTTVALKAIEIRCVADVRALEREVLTLARLDHPHVIKISGVFEDELHNVPVAMIEFKYYAAGDLADWLERTPRGGARDVQIHQGMAQVRVCDYRTVSVLVCAYRVVWVLACASRVVWMMCALTVRCKCCDVFRFGWKRPTATKRVLAMLI